MALIKSNMGTQALLVSNFSPRPRTPSLPLKITCQKSETFENLTLTKTNPPGPMKLPLIGNLHNLAGSLPHRALRDLAREYGPIMHLQLGEISAIVVSSPEMAEQIMKTHDINFARRPELTAAKVVSYDGTDIAFSPYGDYWKMMRRICITEMLGPRRVQGFTKLREEEVSNLVESLQRSAGAPVDLTQKAFDLTSVVVSRAALGNRNKDREAMIALTKAAISFSGGFDLADLFPSMPFLSVISGMRAKLEDIHEKVDSIMHKIITERIEMRKANKGEQVEEDLVDVLLRVQSSGSLECPITTDNIKAVIWDIFSAGTDTSSTTVVWAMAEMLRDPRIIKKAQAEVRQVLKGKKTIAESDIQNLSYMRMVIKETLRMHPPAAMLLPRENKESCVVGGYELPPKTKVIINAWGIMRDNKYWPDADTFIPERYTDDKIDTKGMDFHYIPFGAGRRICPGASFGIANVELPLANLLYHFDWKLPEGMKPADIDMTESFGATVGMKNHLYLIPTPYTPSLDDHEFPCQREDVNGVGSSATSFGVETV